MKSSTLNDYKARMLKVLVYMQQHLDDEQLSLDTLAEVAEFSPYHFHHIFSGMMGESLKEHLRRLRLERAAIELKLGVQSVTDIAFRAGYNSNAAFSRAFKSAFGMAPLVFRSQRRTAATLSASSGVHYRHNDGLQTFKSRPLRHLRVQIKSMSPMRVAFVRQVGPFNQVGAAWDRLLPWLGKEGWLGGDTKFVGLCHDDPEVTAPEKLRYDACVTVDASFRPNGDIGAQEIPGGDYAMTTHIGPYDKIGQTYGRLLGEWLPRSGRQLNSAPCFEMYLNDPASTEPEDLITDIYAPVI